MLYLYMTQNMINHCLIIARHYLPKHPRKESYKHWSFIIKNNQLIEWSTNRAGPPMKYNGYPSYSMIHSEILSYKRAKGLLHGKSFEIINIRLDNKGKLKTAKPCPCCTTFLKNLNCKRIWFSSSDSEIFSKINLIK
jgi:tRNA(Arg) A34 adenosine deaminase TadA